MTCPVCAEQITDRHVTWSDGSETLHMICADALTSSVFRLRSGSAYSRTIFAMLCEMARQERDVIRSAHN